MSFYDDASLVFLPSGEAGKDGKAYSMKPTNGNGDFTFSRGSNLTATRVDSNGLIEKGRENLLLQSNQFDTTWLQTSCSVTSGESGYDGSSNAWLLSKSGSNGRVRQYMTSTGVRTASIYAKEGTTSWLRITYGGKTTYFNLGNGVLGNVNAIDSTITSVGNGFYRCTLTANAASADYVNIYPADSDGVTSGTSGNIYIQDAQLEQGLVATEYIESGASTGKAGILEDSPRFDFSGGASCPSLLLEPSRTNLIGYSEYYNDWDIKTNISFEVNKDTSPEGIVNAQNIYPTATGACFMYENISYTSGETYVYSVFAKSNGKDYLQITTSGSSFGTDYCTFDLSNGTIDNNGFTNADIEDYGNGWYRCYIVVSAIATSSSRIVIGLVPSATSSRLEGITANGTDGVLIYGVSNEQASYPTSYIPNHSGGSVTRNADVNTLLNQSGVIGQTAGTILFDAYFDEEGKVNFSISDSSANNFISIETTSSNEVTAKVEQGGSTQATITTATSFFTEGDRLKCAIAYDDRDMAFYINGTQVNTAAPNLIPACDDIRFGNYDGSIKADQRVNRVVLFTTRISNGNLATLTS